MSSTTARTIDPADAGAAWRRFAIGAVPLLGAFILFFWEFLSRQARWAIQEQADWGHTLVIPLIAGYFVYLKRDAFFARPFRTTWLGLVPILAGLGVYTLASIGPQMFVHHNLQGAGVAITLFGVAILFFGFRGLIWLWFPLVYLAVFGQTISQRVMDMVTFPIAGHHRSWCAHRVADLRSRR